MFTFTNSWNQYLEKMLPKQKDIYYTEEYVKLYETNSEIATCYVYMEENNCFILPFLLRSFDYKGKKYFDFETAYGYGGPIFNTEDTQFLHNAWETFMSYAEKNNYICGFIRFHPLLNNSLGFETFGKIYNDRKTIAIDLSNGIEAAWMNEIHTKNRNVIKKGEKNGLHFIIDNDFCNLEAFKRLYSATMDKLNADRFYYFPSSYYTLLHTSIKNAFLAHVEYEGKYIASAIFVYSLPFGHYHLAGSDPSALNLSPNNFLLWNAAKELYARGVKYFHLGGGTNGNDDNSLYLYKRKFSKNEYQFSFGKLNFNQEIYDSIVNEWTINNPEKAEKFKYFLLKYKY